MVLHQRPVFNAGTIGNKFFARVPSAAQVKGAASKAVTSPFPRNKPGDLPGPVVNLQRLQEVLNTLPKKKCSEAGNLEA